MNCDVCGDAIFVGDWYYKHNGLNICIDCADGYAWDEFVAESALRRSESSELIPTEGDEK